MRLFFVKMRKQIIEDLVLLGLKPQDIINVSYDSNNGVGISLKLRSDVIKNIINKDITNLFDVAKESVGKYIEPISYEYGGDVDFIHVFSDEFGHVYANYPLMGLLYGDYLIEMNDYLIEIEEWFEEFCKESYLVYGIQEIEELRQKRKIMRDKLEQLLFTNRAHTQKIINDAIENQQ